MEFDGWGRSCTSVICTHLVRHDISSKPQVSYPPKSAELQDRPQSGPYAHVLGTGEDEFFGESAVRVSHLHAVAPDLLACLLADQCGLQILGIVLGLLLCSVTQYSPRHAIER
jgi:hypothetical protein